MQQVWQIKEMMALAMLAVSAYTDIRERNIYLFPLLVPCIGSAAVTVISFLGSQGPKDVSILTEFLIFPAITGALLILAAGCMKDQMGMGDGYLMAALGMTAGTRSGLQSIICGLAAASVYAGAVLLGKKGGRRREIPFAPFVLAGYMVVLTVAALRSKQHI